MVSFSVSGGGRECGRESDHCPASFQAITVILAEIACDRSLGMAFCRCLLDGESAGAEAARGNVAHL